MSDLPQTETLDQLYLEWSQFTKVRTPRETKAIAGLTCIVQQMLMRDVSTVSQEEWQRLHLALINVLTKLREP